MKVETSYLSKVQTPGYFFLFLFLVFNFTGTAYSQNADALQPRDLDGDPSTVEAYFYPPQNITWLADANLGLSNTFGLVRGPITDFGSEINERGQMLRDALTEYLTAINDSQYLGYNGWRLPVAQSRDDPGCSVQLADGNTWGTGCTGPEVGEFNTMLNNTYGGLENAPFSNIEYGYFGHWLGSSGPAGRHFYRFGDSGNLLFCGSGRCGQMLVWPVHDGDIGAPIEEPSLQARDLDGDPSTIEAYYYAPQNLTWLADANLGKSNTFGLERGPITEYGSEINDDGEMLRGPLPTYLSAMNDSQYLGYNNWRLPTALGSGDPDCSSQASDGTYTWGTGCTGPEVGEFNAMLVSTYGSVENSPFTNLDSSYTDPGSTRHWLGSYGPAGRHWYMFGNEGNLEFCGTGRCNPALVWPVHDGDIGVPVVQNECIDTDGDGWGWDGSWDGTQSCRVAVVETECIDTEPLDDGWGWNGITSCVCIDTPPLNDGWGWNGVTSCQTEEPAQAGECIDTDGDGWGWDGVQSCVVSQP